MLGEIPAELGNLTNLEVLILSDNDLTGEIPAELGNLTNLIKVRLENNPLTGVIPQGWVRLASLASQRILHIYGTQLAMPPSKDRDALIALYNATNGSKWKNRGNWLKADMLLREWEGVVVDSNDRVSDLNFGGA